jgi:hypothetical protein
MARQLTGKWANGKAANRWESQFLTQDVEGRNRWESQFLTQDVEGRGAQDQPINGKATNG